MKRTIILLAALAMCAAGNHAAHAQKSCQTLYEQEMYKWYNGVFESVDFSAAHWRQSAGNYDDTARRLDDLRLVARSFAGLMGLSLHAITPVDYIREEPANGQTQGAIIDQPNLILGTYTWNSNSAHFRQIQVNAAYLRYESPQTMIHTIAHEIFHARQHAEIETFEAGGDTAIGRDAVELWQSEFKGRRSQDVLTYLHNEGLRRAHLNELNRNLKSARQKLASTPDTYQESVLNTRIKNLQEEIYLMNRDNLFEEYRNWSSEKSANDFAEAIVKVFNDKTTASITAP